MMPLKFWIMWGLLLLAQNAAFTWVSRARNSGSDLYHGIAAVFSNGIWLVASFFTFDTVWMAAKDGNYALAVPAGIMYIIFTVTGSVVMGKFLRRYVEKGNRKVGHYEENAEKIARLAQAIVHLVNVNDTQKQIHVILHERLEALEGGKEDGRSLSKPEGVHSGREEGTARSREDECGACAGDGTKPLGDSAVVQRPGEA